MTSERIMIGQTARRGRWFLVALLLALASALVPALLATGLPATRTVGSAFDPATTAVALRGDAPPLTIEQATAVDRYAGPPPFDAAPVILAVALALVALAARAHPAPAAWPAPARHETLRQSSCAQPRAPPIAIG